MKLEFEYFLTGHDKTGITANVYMGDTLLFACEAASPFEGVVSDEQLKERVAGEFGEFLASRLGVSDV